MMDCCIKESVGVFDDHDNSDENSFPVILNVYNLHPLNLVAHTMGVGAYHSAVEFLGNEYAYGANFTTASSIFYTEPKDQGELNCSILMGYCHMTKIELAEIFMELGKKYTGMEYRIFDFNCHTFCDDLCFRIAGSHAPDWLNRLPRIAMKMSFIMPNDWASNLANEARQSPAPSLVIHDVIRSFYKQWNFVNYLKEKEEWEEKEHIKKATPSLSTSLSGKELIEQEQENTNSNCTDEKEHLSNHRPPKVEHNDKVTATDSEDPSTQSTQNTTPSPSPPPPPAPSSSEIRRRTAKEAPPPSGREQITQHSQTQLEQDCRESQ
eukprot:TRINITY_DN2941_c0_g1_i1.p1 TRINITY_DN2941_c0_g1~~TRINITY_DN2941_c0_g1_i1.p1  ORF type:complete len:322 (+),score=104.18 TRINITY_DN2941_c0_g1_i1:80-1045(+)